MALVKPEWLEVVAPFLTKLDWIIRCKELGITLSADCISADELLLISEIYRGMSEGAKRKRGK